MTSFSLRLGSAGVLAFASLGLAFGWLACLPQEDGSSTSSSGGSSGTSGSTSGDGAVVSQAGQACLDMANAYAHAGARCGDTYEGSKQTFINTVAGGDCNAVTIRNESELRNQCLFTFNDISCSNLREGRYPPSCAEQIIRTK